MSLQDIGRKGSRIDANADGNSLRSYFFDDANDVVIGTDIAGIDAKGLDTAVNGSQSQSIIKVDIGYDRNIDGLYDG